MVKSSGLGKSSKGPSRSSSVSRPVSKPVSRPSASRSVSRPAVSKPAARPTVSKPVSRPSVSKPSTSASRGVFGSSPKPVSRPASSPKSTMSGVSHAPVTPRTTVSSSKSPEAKHGLGLFGDRSSKPVSTSKAPIKKIGTETSYSKSPLKPQVNNSGVKNNNSVGSVFNKSAVTPRHSDNKIKNVAPVVGSTPRVSSTKSRSLPLKANSITSGLSLLDNNSYGSGYGAVPYYGGAYADQYYGDFGYVPSSNMSSREYQENVLLSRIACCFYVAYADNLIMDGEKNQLDFILNDVLKNNKVSFTFKSKVKELAKTRITSFIQAETYFQKVEPEDLIPLISLAEDMADADNRVAAEESKAVSKIRSYVSNMTGYDFDSEAMDDSMYQDNLLLAKLAVCCYIANSDDNFSDDERNEAGIIINQILKNGSVTGSLRDEVHEIVNSNEKSFILVEKYLQRINDEDLIPLINVADEIADKGTQYTIEESKAVNKLRLYVTDRTGEDHMGVQVDEGDLICPGCSGRMEILAGNIIECPYCGTRKTVVKESSSDEE